MVATAVIPAFAAEDIPVAEEVPEGVSAAAAANCEKEKCVNRGCKTGEDERRRCLSWRHPG